MHCEHITSKTTHLKKTDLNGLFHDNVQIYKYLLSLIIITYDRVPASIDSCEISGTNAERDVNFSLPVR